MTDKNPKFFKTYHEIKEQLPGFLDEEGSNLEDILTVYYEWLEKNVTTAITPDFMDVEEVDEDFLDYFTSEFAKFVSLFDVEGIDKRRAVKYSKQLYEKKGTTKSFELFFKLLFKTDPKIYFTNEDVIKSSSIDVTRLNTLVFGIRGTRYENIALNEDLESVSINGEKLDIVSVQRFEDRVEVSYNTSLTTDVITESPGIKASKAVFSFERSRIELSVLSTAISVKTESFTSYGFRSGGFRQGDTITVYPAINDSISSKAIFRVTEVTKGPIREIVIFNAGSGYSVGDRFSFIEGKSEFNAYVSSVNGSGTITQMKVGESLYEVEDATEENPVRLKVNSGSIQFFDSPNIVTSRTNAVGETVSSVTGSGAIINAILPESGIIRKVKLIDQGANLTASNAKPTPLCSLMVGNTDEIVGNPIVEFFTWDESLDTPDWVSQGYGGKILSYSENSGRVTIGPPPEGRVSSIGQTLKTVNANVPISYRTTPIKLRVPQNRTGEIINDNLAICHDLQVLNVTPASFEYGPISQKEEVFTNDRQVLSSLSARLRDKTFYHEYAYFIQTEFSAVDWSAAFNESMHPAGFVYYPDVLTSQDESDLAGIEISEAIKFSDVGFYRGNEVKRYPFPNRTVQGVEDLNVGPNYDGREVVAGAQFLDDTQEIQLSSAFQTETSDEINDLHLRYDVDYDLYWKTILSDEDRTTRYRTPKPVSEILVAQRSGATNVYSTASSDPNYWYKGWTKHSKDLYDQRFNRSIGGTIGVDPEAAKTVYSAFTDYTGNALLREEMQFPKGNTPIRFWNIRKISKGNYETRDEYVNTAFPADQTGTNINKTKYPEVNLCPDRDAYTSIEEFDDETTSTLLPNTSIRLNQGTIDFSMDLRVSIPVNVGDGYRDFSRDSYWDYEPKGINETWSSQLDYQDIDVGTTDKTYVWHLYERYDGTYYDGKLDSWYAPQDFSDGIGTEAPDSVVPLDNGIKMVIQEDVDDVGDLLLYNKLTSPQRSYVLALSTFVRMDDDQKLKYRGIDYNNYINVDVLPRKLEFFLEKENDLQAAINNTLQYTVKVNDKNVTFTGIEAFNRKWQG